MKPLDLCGGSHSLYCTGKTTTSIVALDGGCAGAISVIDRLDDEFLAEVRRKSLYIFNEMIKAEGVRSVTGMGLMIGIETDRPAADVVADCRDKGVLCLTAKHKVRLLPALNMPWDVLKEAVEVLKSACKGE